MLNEKQSSETAVIEPLASDERLIEVWLYGGADRAGSAGGSGGAANLMTSRKPVPPALASFLAGLVRA